MGTLKCWDMYGDVSYEDVSYVDVSYGDETNGDVKYGDVSSLYLLMGGKLRAVSR
jgi:hypothetical protein